MNISLSLKRSAMWVSLMSSIYKKRKNQIKLINLLNCLFVGFIGLTLAMPTYASRVAIRGTGDYPELRNNHHQFPFVRQHMDMGYAMDERLHFNAQFTFPEYYIPWHHNQMDTNPHTNPLVQWILNYGGNKGTHLYGLKISRESDLVPWSPAGPFPQDPRILFVSDVSAIRQVLTAAKNAGILARDNYKLFNMVTEPNFFVHNAQARDTIKLMDGVCYEAHHFNVHWPLHSGRSNPPDVVDGALWTLNNFNVHGKRLEYVMYYGPYRRINNCGFAGDPFRYYMNEYWAEGLPKDHPHLIYDMNAFKHACGSSRPALPESDPFSITGCAKWLIENVKGINGGGGPPPPGGSIKHLRKRNAMGFAIDGGGNPYNGHNVYMFTYDANNVNQQWEEINRGGGYYTYKKRGTSFVIDGSPGGALDQNVKLWSEGTNNHNQHWKKVNMGGGFHRLEKRNASGYSIDGSGGGANFNNVKLWSNNNGNWNQHWKID